MYEENFALKKIEQWVDKLPYKWVKIEVELRQGHPEWKVKILVLCRVYPMRKRLVT